jgi:cation-transporting ATPase 13A3/4/5
MKSYVFDQKNRLFYPYEFLFGPNSIDLHSHSVGITSIEAGRRLLLNGPNEILFEMPSIQAMIFEEFTGIFYIYQYMILLIWWFYVLLY